MFFLKECPFKIGVGSLRLVSGFVSPVATGVSTTSFSLESAELSFREELPPPDDPPPLEEPPPDYAPPLA